MKKECLTITKNIRSAGKRTIETELYELLSTGKDNVRYIDIIEKETTRKKTTYKYQHKRMDLETGHYINADCHTWDDTQPQKFKNRIDEWLALPIADIYKTHGGLSSIEIRYLKGE